MGDVGVAIGARLAEVRGDEQQGAFADGILSQSALSQYERGLIPQSWLTLRKLVEERGIDANWLLTGRPASKNGGRR